MWHQKGNDDAAFKDLQKKRAGSLSWQAVFVVSIMEDAPQLCEFSLCRCGDAERLGGDEISAPWGLNHLLEGSLFFLWLKIVLHDSGWMFGLVVLLQSESASDR